MPYGGSWADASFTSRDSSGSRTRGRRQPCRSGSRSWKPRSLRADQGQTGVRITDGRHNLEASCDHAKREIAIAFIAMPRELSFRVGTASLGPVAVKPRDTVTLRSYSDHSAFEIDGQLEAVN